MKPAPDAQDKVNTLVPDVEAVAKKFALNAMAPVKKSGNIPAKPVIKPVK